MRVLVVRWLERSIEVLLLEEFNSLVGVGGGGRS